ncbi:autotransporter domain-containing protein [Candidatus Omnitrophota bacterium]
MKILVTLAAFVLIICQVCFAADYYDSSPGQQEESQRIAYAQGDFIDFTMGTELSYFAYEEPKFMEDKGFLYGAFGTLTYLTQENYPINTLHDIFSEYSNINRLELDARLSWGYVDYKSEDTGEMSDVRDYIFEVRGLAGYDVPHSEDLLITPYLGVGYRHLNDDSGGRSSTTNHLGYERKSNYFYMPIGIECTTWMFEGWEISVQVEYDLFLYGQQISHLETAVAGYNTLYNDQNGGYGTRCALKVAKKNERVDFFIEPFFRFWHIEDSEISAITYNNVLEGFGLEPENKSIEGGLRIGAKF